MSEDIISSISYDQTEIINNILEIHVPNKMIDLDMCYSKGYFYKNGKIPQPIHKIDLIPQVEDCIEMDCSNTSFENESMSCIMFDPPFLATQGKSLENKTGIITSRFGCYKNMPELYEFYEKALKESHRLLNDGGILIFKCQDTVSGGKQWMSHCYIHNMAVKLGFYPIDLFVLLSKSRINPSWWGKSKHSRKYHCYFWVFKKDQKNVNYLTERVNDI